MKITQEQFNILAAVLSWADLTNTQRAHAERVLKEIVATKEPETPQCAESTTK